MKIIDLLVCPDCIQYIANGDITEGLGNLPEQINRYWPHNEGWILAAGSSENDDPDDEAFSWAYCDSCNSGLGGPRYAAHAIQSNPQQEPE